MKRLFEVNGQYFGNKMKAKLYRDMNGGYVSKGPDHKDYEKQKKTHLGSSGHKQGKSNGDGFKRRKIGK